ncbi:unknown [Prevotella sp. CAG:873]|nr:unknown [Prevotella sp. CAG:873]
MVRAASGIVVLPTYVVTNSASHLRVLLSTTVSYLALMSLTPVRKTLTLALMPLAEVTVSTPEVEASLDISECPSLIISPKPAGHSRV